MPFGPYFWGATGNMWQAAGFKEHMDFFRDENSVMVEAGIADVNKDAYFLVLILAMRKIHIRKHVICKMHLICV